MLCIQKICMEENHKLRAQHKCRLDPLMKELVRKEVINYLDDGTLCLIFLLKEGKSYVMSPKKGGMIVVKNEEKEFIH